ncbi:hypothetical protein [Lacticaseibacillus chiayiensis]|nr:hypothetical protein [Lacticaseibacillus chiayiensis]
MFKQFSKLGRAFMLPIAILPAAGLLLGTCYRPRYNDIKKDESHDS